MVRRDPIPEERVDSSVRAAEQELATLAADVRHGLQQRLDADEPLTTEFVLLLSDWSGRVLIHRWMAATAAAEREEAASQYWREAKELYRSTWPDYDPNVVLPQVPISEYALREAELLLVDLRLGSPAPDAAPASIHSGRPLSDIARDAWALIQTGTRAAEPLTPTWVELACEVSRELWLAEWSEAPRREAGPATDRHVERLTGLMNRLRSVDMPDGQALQQAIRYSVAEARLTGDRAWRDNENTPAMVDAARGQVEWLWRRQAAGEPPAPQFVQNLCVWSQRLMWAEQRSGDEQGVRDAAARHLRRMRDLHAELKRRFDADGDVSQVQVSQAAYFLRDAEITDTGVATRPTHRGGFMGRVGSRSVWKPISLLGFIPNLGTRMNAPF